MPELKACLECKAIFLNINLGHNRELMERCKRLNEYATLVHQVRTYQANGMELEAAVEAAVAYCISNGIMEHWLSIHRAEVIDVLLTEYDEEEHMRMERAEAKAEGRTEGRAEGKLAGKVEDIFELLGELGEIPDELIQTVTVQKDANILNRWLKEAAKAKTIEMFLESIRK